MATVPVTEGNGPSPTARSATTRPPETRGRPRIREDHEILDAALRAFASQGYDAMSLRSLNAELGLSHGTISQRFGTKERLYYAAIDIGFTTFFEDIARRRSLALGPDATTGDVDDLDELRVIIRSFLGAALLRPELGRLMNQEGLNHSPRLEYIVDNVLVHLFTTVGVVLDRLRASGRVRPVSARALFFLVAHGAEAPYTLGALSEAFDVVDGPLDPEAHADDVTDLIMRGIAVA